MRYLMFIRHSADYRTQEVPAALNDAMGEFVQTGIKNGTLIDTAGLEAGGKRVALRGGRITVIDGPFTEAKEIVGGYAIVETASEVDAVQIARDFLDLHRVHWPGFDGECEVRAFQG
jgi:hypothetical protein